MAHRTNDSREKLLFLHIPIHPELRKALKLRAVHEDRTMPEILHAMLCGELDREDLLMQVPDATPAAR